MAAKKKNKATPSITPAEAAAGTKVRSKIFVSHKDDVVLVLAASGSAARAIYSCDNLDTPEGEFEETFDNAQFAQEGYRIARKFPLQANALYALNARVTTQPGIGQRLIKVLVNDVVKFSVFVPPPAEDPTDAQLLIAVN